MLAYFSERECLEFQRSQFPLNLPGNQKSGKLASEAQLHIKGAVMEAMNYRRTVESQLSTTEAGRRLLSEREPLLGQYQQAYLAKGSLDEEVKSLQRRMEDLDKQATTLLSGGKDVAVPMSVGLKEVQASIGGDQILVETFRYDHRREDKKLESHYASTVISALGEPVFISHGPADPIEEAIRQYRSLIQKSDPDIAKLSADERDRQLAETEKSLYSALLAPLNEHLSSAKTVIFSPDAQLHFLPLGLIRDSEGRTFNDQYRIRYVSSGRDLVKPVLSGGEGKHSALLLGNPSYRDNAPMTALAEAEEEDSHEKGLLADNLRAGMDQESGSIQFSPLPGTARETALLADLFAGGGYEVASLGGEDATEESVMEQMGGHDVIHLATHGFFLNEIKIGREEPESLMGENRPKGHVQNPMFRSGLALAGAQSTFNLWKSGQVPPPSRDGVLLAAEITGVDLRGTDLVVLSACETAAGESLDGEGVIGLRRAFNAAGVQNLVMTLWPVNDAATVEVMEVFYRKYLSGTPAPEALAETQRELLPKWIETHGATEALARFAPFICTSLGSAK